MAICRYCGQEMHEAASCVGTHVTLRDGRYERVPWGNETKPWDHGPRCGDCDVLPGGIHHMNCDIEECPRCHGQLLTCECWPEGE